MLSIVRFYPRMAVQVELGLQILSQIPAPTRVDQNSLKSILAQLIAQNA